MTKLIWFVPIIGNDNATTTTKEEAGGNNEYGKYATIKQRNGNHLTTNQEIDQDDIGELEDDDNLQITSKLDLTGKFETATTSSAWVGPEIDFSISSSFRNIKHKNQSTKRTLGYRYYLISMNITILVIGIILSYFGFWLLVYTLNTF